MFFLPWAAGAVVALLLVFHLAGQRDVESQSLADRVAAGSAVAAAAHRSRAAWAEAYARDTQSMLSDSEGESYRRRGFPSPVAFTSVDEACLIRAYGRRADFTDPVSGELRLPRTALWRARTAGGLNCLSDRGADLDELRSHVVFDRPSPWNPPGPEHWVPALDQDRLIPVRGPQEFVHGGPGAPLAAYRDHSRGPSAGPVGDALYDGEITWVRDLRYFVTNASDPRFGGASGSPAEYAVRTRGVPPPADESGHPEGPADPSDDGVDPPPVDPPLTDPPLSPQPDEAVAPSETETEADPVPDVSDDASLHHWGGGHAPAAYADPLGGYWEVERRLFAPGGASAGVAVAGDDGSQPAGRYPGLLRELLPRAAVRSSPLLRDRLVNVQGAFRQGRDGRYPELVANIPRSRARTRLPDFVADPGPSTLVADLDLVPFGADAPSGVAHPSVVAGGSRRLLGYRRDTQSLDLSFDRVVDVPAGYADGYDIQNLVHGYALPLPGAGTVLRGVLRFGSAELFAPGFWTELSEVRCVRFAASSAEPSALPESAPDCDLGGALELLPLADGVGQVVTHVDIVYDPSARPASDRGYFRFHGLAVTPGTAVRVSYFVHDDLRFPPFGFARTTNAIRTRQCLSGDPTVRACAGQGRTRLDVVNAPLMVLQVGAERSGDNLGIAPLRYVPRDLGGSARFAVSALPAAAGSRSVADPDARAGSMCTLRGLYGIVLFVDLSAVCADLPSGANDQAFVPHFSDARWAAYNDPGAPRCFPRQRRRPPVALSAVIAPGEAAPPADPAVAHGPAGRSAGRLRPASWPDESSPIVRRRRHASGTRPHRPGSVSPLPVGFRGVFLHDLPDRKVSELAVRILQITYRSYQAGLDPVLWDLDPGPAVEAFLRDHGVPEQHNAWAELVDPELAFVVDPRRGVVPGATASVPYAQHPPHCAAGTLTSAFGTPVTDSASALRTPVVRRAEADIRAAYRRAVAIHRRVTCTGAAGRLAELRDPSREDPDRGPTEVTVPAARGPC